MTQSDSKSLSQSELGARFKYSFKQLKEKTEAAENWKSETIDIRKLVFYIDILNDMAENDNDKHRQGCSRVKRDVLINLLFSNAILDVNFEHPII